MENVETVSKDLQQWRAEHRARRFPSELKRRVVALLKGHGVGEVAQGLRVTPAQLHHWRSVYAEPEAEPGIVPAMPLAASRVDGEFLELRPGAVPAVPASTLELELELPQDRRRLRVRGEMDAEFVCHIVLALCGQEGAP